MQGALHQRSFDILNYNDWLLPSASCIALSFSFPKHDNILTQSIKKSLTQLFLKENLKYLFAN